MAISKLNLDKTPESPKQLNVELYVESIEQLDASVEMAITKLQEEVKTIKESDKITEQERESALKGYNIRNFLNDEITNAIHYSLTKEKGIKIEKDTIKQHISILMQPLLSVYAPLVKQIEEEITETKTIAENPVDDDAEEIEVKEIFNIFGHLEQIPGRSEEYLDKSKNKAYTLAQAQLALDSKLLVEQCKEELAEIWRKNEFADPKMKLHWVRLLKKLASALCFVASTKFSFSSMDSFLQGHDINGYFGSHSNVRHIIDLTVALGMSSTILGFKNRILDKIGDTQSVRKGISTAYKRHRKAFLLGAIVSATSLTSNGIGILRDTYEGSERQAQIDSVNAKIEAATTTFNNQKSKLEKIPSLIEKAGNTIVTKEEAGSSTSKAAGKGIGWASKAATFSGSAEPFNQIGNPNAKGLKSYLQSQGAINNQSPRARVQKLLSTSFDFEAQNKNISFTNGLKEIKKIQKGISPEMTLVQINGEFKKIIPLLKSMDAAFTEDTGLINNEIERLNEILLHIDTINAAKNADKSLISKMEVDVKPVDISAIQAELNKAKVGIKSIPEIYKFIKQQIKLSNPSTKESEAAAAAITQMLALILLVILIDLGDTVIYGLLGVKKAIARDDKAAIGSIDLAERANQKYTIISKLHKLLNSKEVNTFFPHAEPISRDVVETILDDFISRNNMYMLRSEDEIPEKTKGVANYMKQINKALLVPRKSELQVLRAEKVEVEKALTNKNMVLELLEKFLPGINKLYETTDPSAVSFADTQKKYSDGKKKLDITAEQLQKDKDLIKKQRKEREKINNNPYEEEKPVGKWQKFMKRVLDGKKKK
ncbi:MAG: hypothetical protein ACK4NC_02070 [Candidatus Gracilibacteria bacterium]